MQARLIHQPNCFGVQHAGGKCRRLLLLAAFPLMLWLLSTLPAPRYFLHTAPEFVPTTELATPPEALPAQPDGGAAEFFQQQQSKNQQNRAQQECGLQPFRPAWTELQLPGKIFFGRSAPASPHVLSCPGAIQPIRAGPTRLV